LPRKASANNGADRAFRRSGILSVSLLNGLNGAQRLNDWNVWNGLIPVMNGAKRLNGWNDWNGPGL
jgi:hypothetical protein